MFTDIAIPVEYYTDVMKRQAVVNPGVTFLFRNQTGSTFEETVFRYEHGIQDYVAELAGDNALTTPVFFQTERTGRDQRRQAGLPGQDRRQPVLFQHSQHH